MILSFISSFKIDKVNLASSLISTFPLIFLSKSLIAFKTKLLTKPGKLSLAKGIATFCKCLFYLN